MSISFNDTTTKRGLIQICETTLWGDGSYGMISGNANRLLQFTSLLNDGLDKAVTKILGADTRWQFDDTNYTNYPIGTATLVDNQQDYTLDLDTTGLLKITGVDALDADGNYYPLIPFDERDVRDRGISITEFHETKGRPRYYDAKANAVFLYPRPDTTQVTAANGLRVTFQREPSYFASTDTTKEPGIPSVFHKLVAYYATEEYAIDNQMIDKATLVRERQIIPIEGEMDEFFSKRDKDSRPRLTVRRRSSV